MESLWKCRSMLVHMEKEEVVVAEKMHEAVAVIM